MSGTDWIQRAERALRTGQPNLAMLYMRRGISESAEGRAWLAWTDFSADVTAAARRVGIFLDDLFASIRPPLTQADFVLLPDRP
jgi:hypothetical protein